MYKFQFPRASGGSRGAGGETRHSTPTVTDVYNICHPGSSTWLRKRKKKEGHREKEKMTDQGAKRRKQCHGWHGMGAPMDWFGMEETADGMGWDGDGWKGSGRRRRPQSCSVRARYAHFVCFQRDMPCTALSNAAADPSNLTEASSPPQSARRGIGVEGSTQYG